MNWTAMLTEQAKTSYGAARSLVEMVDDQHLAWRPETGSNWLTTGQLIRHISNSCGLSARAYLTGKWTDGDHGISPEWKPQGESMLPPAELYLSHTKSEALAALDGDQQAFLAALQEAGEKRLESERLSAPWGGPERTLGEHFLDCIHHLNTHRAQLFYYLKLQGRTVNTMHMWGM